MTGDADDRELLLEALAVHLGFVPPRALDDLEAARRRAAASPAGRPLVQTLVESSVLTAEQCAVLETLADNLLERHGDVCRSLDTLAAFGRLRAELERRRAGARGAGDSSNTPTLPSFPVNGERPGQVTPGEELDDSFLPGGVDHSADDRGSIEPGSVAGTLGMPTAGGARFRILRPHAQGGSARSRSPSTTSSSARWRSSRSSPSAPTTPTAGPGSSWRPRSPAGSSTRGLSRYMAWAWTTTAGRSTPCGSYGAPPSMRRSTPSTAQTRIPGATRRNARWPSGTCSTGSSTSARPSPTPTTRACSTAT